MNASMCRLLGGPIVAVVFSCGGVACADVVDFDGVAADPLGTLYAGNTFAAAGVTFTSGSIPDSISVGGTFVLSDTDNQLLVLGNDNNHSPPNFAAASLVFVGASNDLLMSFAMPVTSVQLTTDDALFENPDVVRLLALAPAVNPLEFEVLAIVEGLDNAMTGPANLMSVNLGGPSFSFALFQATTEPEGFDDLTFTFVAEPQAMGLAWLALAAAAARAGRQGQWQWRNIAGPAPRGASSRNSTGA